MNGTPISTVSARRLEAHDAHAPAQAAPWTVPPLPHPDARLAPDDALAALYTLIAAGRDDQLRAGEHQVHAAHARQARELEELRSALRRVAEAEAGAGLFASIAGAIERLAANLAKLRVDAAWDGLRSDAMAAWNSPQLWRDLEVGALWVAKIAAAVGSLALTTVTLGGAAPAVVIAAVALSAGGFAVARTGCFGERASPWVALGLELAAVGVSVGAAFGPTATDAALRTVATVGTVAMTASGAAHVVAGGTHVRRAHVESTALEAHADATRASYAIERQRRFAAWLLGALEAAVQAHERALGTLQEAMSVRARTFPLAARA